MHYSNHLNGEMFPFAISTQFIKRLLERDTSIKKALVIFSSIWKDLHVRWKNMHMVQDFKNKMSSNNTDNICSKQICRIIRETETGLLQTNSSGSDSTEISNSCSCCGWWVEKATKYRIHRVEAMCSISSSLTVKQNASAEVLTSCENETMGQNVRKTHCALSKDLITERENKKSSIC